MAETIAIQPTICDDCGLMYQAGGQHMCPAKMCPPATTDDLLQCPTCESPRVYQKYRRQSRMFCARCGSYFDRDEAIPHRLSQ